MAKQFGVMDVANLTLYRLTDMVPVLRLDVLKMSDVETSTQRAELRGGKGNKKIMTVEYDRNIQLKCQNAVLNPKAIALQVGRTVEVGAQPIFTREVLTAEAGTTGKTKVTPSQTYLPNSVVAFKEDDDYGTQLDATEATGNTVEFNDTDVAVGEKVIVYYKYNSGATTEMVNITASDFSDYYFVTGDVLMYPYGDESVKKPCQLQIAKAKVLGDFNLSLKPDEFAVFDFNLEVYTDAATDSMIKFVWY